MISDYEMTKHEAVLRQIEEIKYNTHSPLHRQIEINKVIDNYRLFLLDQAWCTQEIEMIVRKLRG